MSFNRQPVLSNRQAIRVRLARAGRGITVGSTPKPSSTILRRHS